MQLHHYLAILGSELQGVGQKVEEDLEVPPLVTEKLVKKVLDLLLFSIVVK